VPENIEVLEEEEKWRSGQRPGWFDLLRCVAYLYAHHAAAAVNVVRALRYTPLRATASRENQVLSMWRRECYLSVYHHDVAGSR